jgi:hypothetical protein
MGHEGDESIYDCDAWLESGNELVDFVGSGVDRNQKCLGRTVV